MYDEERTITLSHHANTRIHLVHLGFQYSRICMSQYRYFSRMACNLASHCNFLYRFFQCQLLEDTIDVEITVRILKEIHTFKKECSTQTSLWSPLGLHIHPFPSLVKKMEAFLEERRNIKDPFHLTHTYPARPDISPFTRSQIPKRKKAKNPKKRSRTESH